VFAAIVAFSAKVRKKVKSPWVAVQLVATVTFTKRTSRTSSTSSLGTAVLPWCTGIEDPHLRRRRQEGSRRSLPLRRPLGLRRKAANLFRSLGSLPCRRQQALDQDRRKGFLPHPHARPPLPRPTCQQNVELRWCRSAVQRNASLVW